MALAACGMALSRLPLPHSSVTTQQVLHFGSYVHCSLFVQWFGTYNYLNAVLPLPVTIIQKLLRSAVIGFAASIASDTISNSLRVLKTYRQVNATRIGYADAARAVIAADGLKGLFGRGLKTRILANGLQGIMFSVLWKLFLDL
jgi:hypothetical protein